jgi:hypothetical protein
MYARFLTYQIRPGLIEQRLRHAREVCGPARGTMSGQKGRLILIDPGACRARTGSERCANRRLPAMTGW